MDALAVFQQRPLCLAAEILALADQSGGVLAVKKHRLADIHKQIHNGAGFLSRRLCAEVEAEPLHRHFSHPDTVVNALGQQQDTACGEQNFPVFVGEGDDLLTGENAVKFNGIMLVGAVVAEVFRHGGDPIGTDVTVGSVQLGVKFKLGNRVNLGSYWMVSKVFSDKLDNTPNPNGEYGKFWNNQDWYSTVQVYLSVSFYKICAPCRNGVKKKKEVWLR